MILWNNFVRKIKRFMETNIWNRGGNDKIKRRRKLEEKMSSYPVTRHNVSSVFIVYSNTRQLKEINEQQLVKYCNFFLNIYVESNIRIFPKKN